MSLLLLTEAEIAQRHNAMPETLPYAQLPEQHKAMVRQYHLSGGIVEGVKLGHHVVPRGRYTATKRLVEQMAQLKEGDPWDITNTNEFQQAHQSWSQDEEEDAKLLKRLHAKDTRAQENPDRIYSDIDDLAKSLMPRVVNDDEEAWAEIFRAFYPYALAVARQQLYYYPSLQNEVASDALRDIWKHRKAWEPGTGLKAWVKSTVRGAAYNLEDKEKTRNPLSLKQLADEHPDENEEGEMRQAQAPAVAGGPTPAAAAEHKDEVTELLGALGRMTKQLPEQQARVLLMYAFEEKRVDDIARELKLRRMDIVQLLAQAQESAKQWLTANPDFASTMRFFQNESKQCKNLHPIVERWIRFESVNFDLLTEELSSFIEEHEQASRSN